MANWLSLLKDYHHAMKMQWKPRETLVAMQQRRLSILLDKAYRSVPYYRQLFQEAGIRPNDITTVEDLRRFPVSTKSDLREHALSDRMTAGLDPSSLKSESSSGSTGTPFTVYFDKTYYRTRSLIFLRALTTAGYRLGQRLLLVTQTGPQKQAKRWINWHYASIEDPPERLVAACRQVRPHVIYGCTTALRLLAENWDPEAAPSWTPRAMITTAEGLDAATRTLLASSFRTKVYDFYGLSEMGLIGWECPSGNGYHLAEDLVIAEFLPVTGSPSLFRLVLTNLAQEIMPFIRYDTGDLCMPISEPCPCGRSLALVRAFEGREIDCITLADGTKISPYRITCEFEKLDHVQRYQVQQKDYNKFTVLLESGHRQSDIGLSAVNCLNRLLGTQADITVQVVPQIEHTPGRKFRVVESRVALSGNKDRTQMVQTP